MNVHRHCTVCKVPSHHLCEPRPLNRDGLVHPLAQLLLDVHEFRPYTVRPAFTAQHERAAPRHAPNVGKFQEVKGLRFAKTALPSSFSRIAAKLQQPGLVRMECERKLR